MTRPQNPWALLYVPTVAASRRSASRSPSVQTPDRIVTVRVRGRHRERQCPKESSRGDGRIDSRLRPGDNAFQVGLVRGTGTPCESSTTPGITRIAPQVYEYFEHR